MPPNWSRITPPTDGIDDLAVFVRKTQDGTHAGIVYRGSDGTLRLLHQAFHLNLRDDEFVERRGRFVCVVPSLLHDELVALAGYCRRIYLVNSSRGGIPYNLELELNEGFDPVTGDLVMPGSATGMSCATFVVHVFRSAGNEIVDPTDWPRATARAGDVERQEQLIRMMEQNPSPEYQRQADRIRSQRGCPRIRPEDVAGACLEDSLPARFAQCDRNGRLLLGVIDCRCGQYP